MMHVMQLYANTSSFSFSLSLSLFHCFLHVTFAYINSPEIISKENYFGAVNIRTHSIIIFIFSISINIILFVLLILATFHKSVYLMTSESSTLTHQIAYYNSEMKSIRKIGSIMELTGNNEREREREKCLFDLDRINPELGARDL